ncbi:MAG: non-canonical purine NTP pyrophosphatase, RdgB/HAM1 family [Bacteroidetes bacterium 41-46]|jgi:XTP/dITP diphosphohydrolase|nr:MAG: non-canonical purine NTP pyrophosphatase, RdgB/HAM1 family [Bacteroidetes bacterium 41-46]
MELLFATANKHKLSEAIEILGPCFNLTTPLAFGFSGEIPETALTLEENSLMKASFLWDMFHHPCFADDTGLIVDALGGRPGVHSARYAGPEGDSVKNTNLLLQEMRGITSRRARFATCVTLILSKEEIFLFEGRVEGRIANEPSGTGGFGYDPVFIPDGYDKTLAELTPQEKNIISHRGEAMRKLSEFLNQYCSK